MKRMIGTAAFLLSVSAGAIAAAQTKSAIFLVIENGGVVTDREAAIETISFTFGELAQLRRRRATKDTQIHLLLTANPTEVSWSGTPQQLFDQGQHVLELIEFRDTCSDLVLAWDQVRLTARITMPDDIQLVGIGPMIHAGFPCDSGETTISLPQSAPAGLALADLAGQASVVRMVNVHADQDEVYLDYFTDAGLIERARAGAVDFDLMDAARTRAALGHILGGHER
ncbi:hypothetical protein RGUI_3187 [Rhodovulum sp. P5]|uniref:hypothetical protein n=1 Tax=Rhodovulum sp. P5 TaxID=1564506 RepID=UPI0009C363BC|nr:hypothetical protein [Rhodovulum sp. P5]ARE41328.1 hypothetical protein RGUI_3187 [Rhodovulum sp. P5]